VSFFGDQYGMLKLSRPSTVAGGGCPGVLPNHVFVCAFVNHRLDRENVSRPHKANGLVASVVRNLRCLMEETAHTMALIVSNDAVAFGLCDFGDDVADFSIHGTRFTNFDCFHQALISCVNQSNTCVVHLAHAICFVEVSMKAILVATDVQVDNVALLKWPGVRDAVADDFVDGGAAASGELVVV
jgi:hypothetical protein